MRHIEFPINSLGDGNEQDYVFTKFVTLHFDGVFDVKQIIIHKDKLVIGVEQKANTDFKDNLD